MEMKIHFSKLNSAKWKTKANLKNSRNSGRGFTEMDTYMLMFDTLDMPMIRCILLLQMAKFIKILKQDERKPLKYLYNNHQKFHNPGFSI